MQLQFSWMVLAQGLKVALKLLSGSVVMSRFSWGSQIHFHGRPHWSAYGSWLLAKWVIQEIRATAFFIT